MDHTSEGEVGAGTKNLRERRSCLGFYENSAGELGDVHFLDRKLLRIENWKALLEFRPICGSKGDEQIGKSRGHPKFINAQYGVMFTCPSAASAGRLNSLRCAWW